MLAFSLSPVSTTATTQSDLMEGGIEPLMAALMRRIPVGIALGGSLDVYALGAGPEAAVSDWLTLQYWTAESHSPAYDAAATRWDSKRCSIMKATIPTNIPVIIILGFILGTSFL